MNTIMLAANMKPRKRRKKPPRRRRRWPSGGLTGAVMSMVEPVPTLALEPRGTRSNPSEDYGNKTLASREILYFQARVRRAAGQNGLPATRLAKYASIDAATASAVRSRQASEVRRFSSSGLLKKPSSSRTEG